MIDFLNSNFNEVEKYFIDNVDSIDLLDIIKIDKTNYGRYDMLILSKYGYSYKTYVNQILILILSYNNLADITDISIGTIIKLPDLDSLIENIEELDIHFSDIVPGVNTVNPNDVNSSAAILAQKTKNKKITALPKLNITLPKVSYDSESGIITY